MVTPTQLGKLAKTNVFSCICPAISNFADTANGRSGNKQQGSQQQQQQQQQQRIPVAVSTTATRKIPICSTCSTLHAPHCRPALPQLPKIQQVHRYTFFVHCITISGVIKILKRLRHYGMQLVFLPLCCQRLKKELVKALRTHNSATEKRRY